ncbi:hypothetical protein BsWGS_22408 [Bradybaena similaris]
MLQDLKSQYLDGVKSWSSCVKACIIMKNKNASRQKSSVLALYCWFQVILQKCSVYFPLNNACIPILLQHSCEFTRFHTLWPKNCMFLTAALRCTQVRASPFCFYVTYNNTSRAIYRTVSKSSLLMGLSCTEF